MLKRLKGGLILLNLCAISLNMVSGEVNIENQDVLDQLTELRNFIDEKRDFTKEHKGLKPVLVQYRSNESKFDGIVECGMSFHDDALHLSIAGYSVQADGTPVTLVINVVYEWTEYIGYTIKSAKLIASTGVTHVKVDDVKNIDGEILSQLKCGDVVIKEDATGEHAYVVTFKSESGICLTYTDASVVETQSYDLVDDEWVYNSEDKTEFSNFVTFADITGGTIENAKPIYFHPINVVNTVSFYLGFIILNNDSTQLDTKDKLLSVMRAIQAELGEGNTARFPATGSFTLSSKQYIAYSIEVPNQTLVKIYGRSVEDGTSNSIEIQNLTFNATYDGVNKIN